MSAVRTICEYQASIGERVSRGHDLGALVPPINLEGGDSQSIDTPLSLRRLPCLPSIRAWMIVGGIKL